MCKEPCSLLRNSRDIISKPMWKKNHKADTFLAKAGEMAWKRRKEKLLQMKMIWNSYDLQIKIGIDVSIPVLP